MNHTKTRPHQWMSMTVQPVQVLGLDSQGEPAIFLMEEPVTRVGCFACDLGLTPMAMETPCEGDADAEG